MTFYEGPFPVIETERLRLRALDLADCHDLLQVFSSEEVMRWYGMFPISGLEDSVRLIESLRSAYVEKRGLRWAITDKATGRLMGTCGYHNHNIMARRAEIGYELGKAFWGQGYAKEAIEAIMAWGFDQLNLHRIEALTYPENKPSQQVLETLGFQQEGLLRGYAYFRNIYQDLILFSCINENHSRLI